MVARQDFRYDGTRHNVDHRHVWTKINKAVEQSIRPQIFVFILHMPAAIAASLATCLDLNRTQPRAFGIAYDDVSVRYALRRECRDTVAAQQLAHHVVLASGTQ